MASNYYWTPTQTTILKSAYSTGGLRTAQQLLPEKSRTTIAAKASRLGITTPKPRKPK